MAEALARGAIRPRGSEARRRARASKPGPAAWRQVVPSLLAERLGGSGFPDRATGRTECLTLGLLAVPAILVSIPLMSLGFFGDDLHHMSVAAACSISELLLSREAITAICSVSLTPLLGVSFRVDWLASGTDCWSYNAQNLFWLWLVGCSAYVLFRRLRAGVVESWLAGMILQVAPVTVSVAAYYASRHYLFGLVSALFSLTALIDWTAKGGWYRLGVALLLYFTACVSKETYFPLLFVATFVIPGGPKRRACVLTCYTAVGAAYIGLRTAALGTLVGSYGAGDYDLVSVLLYLIRSWPYLTDAVLIGSTSPWLGAVLANALLLASGVAAWRVRRLKGVGMLVLLGGASLCTVAFVLGHPMIRYAESPGFEPNDRLVFAFSSAALLGMAYLLIGPGTPVRRRRTPTLRILTACLASVALSASGVAKSLNWRDYHLHRAQWQFIEDHASSDLVVVGRPYSHLPSYIALLARSREVVKLRSPARGESIDDYRGLEPSKVALVVPNQAIRTAHNRGEMMSWLAACGLEMQPRDGHLSRKPLKYFRPLKRRLH